MDAVNDIKKIGSWAQLMGSDRALTHFRNRPSSSPTNYEDGSILSPDLFGPGPSKFFKRHFKKGAFSEGFFVRDESWTTCQRQGGVKNGFWRKEKIKLVRELKTGSWRKEKLEAKRELKTGAWRMEKIKLKATRGLKMGSWRKEKIKLERLEGGVHPDSW